MAPDTRAEAERSVQFHTRTYASEYREALERTIGAAQRSCATEK